MEFNIGVMKLACRFQIAKTEELQHVLNKKKIDLRGIAVVEVAFDEHFSTGVTIS